MVDDGRSSLPAFLVAVPAAVAIWLVTYLVYAVFVLGPGEAGRVVPYVMMGGLIFAVPLVAAVTAFVAYPCFLVLRRLGRLSIAAALVAGGLLGILTRAVVIALWASPEARFVPIPVVIVTGVGTAALWWAAWTRPPRGIRGRGAL